MNPKQLAFGELEPLAGAFLSVLLALMLARIAGEKTGFLQLRPQLPIEFDQGTGNAQPDRVGLTGNTTAVGENQNIELVGHLSDEKSLADRDAPGFGRKIFIQRTTVNCDVALAGTEEYAGDRGLATPRPQMLLNLSCWHSLIPFLILFFLCRDSLTLHDPDHWLLGCMRVLVPRVNLQLPVHLLP